MKRTSAIALATTCLSIGWLAGEPLPPGEDSRTTIEIHNEGSLELGESQDELSADVQQLILEQTHPKVVELLGEVEDIMDEATERLVDADTGSETIAAQTEVIEKIHAAAKERQKQCKGGGNGSGAMMEMLERMMGKKGEGKKPGKQGKPGQQAGMGNGGDSDSPNTDTNGIIGGGTESERRIPKSSGTGGQSMPSEFHKALDAYNRGLTGTIK